jgi:hypothetical protein
VTATTRPPGNGLLAASYSGRSLIDESVGPRRGPHAVVKKRDRQNQRDPGAVGAESA